MDISFADTSGHRAPLRLASEKLLNPAIQEDHFYIAKSDISKIVAYKGEISKI
jgi:hypothetical protein